MILVEICARPRFEMMAGNIVVRYFLGAVLVVAASYFAFVSYAVPFQTVAIPLLLSWLFSAWLTDKYRHKYHQRYYPYLLASHGKAAGIMGLSMVAFATAFPELWSSRGHLIPCALFLFGDFLLSVPRRRTSETTSTEPGSVMNKSPASVQEMPAVAVDVPAVSAKLGECYSGDILDRLRAFIGEQVNTGGDGVKAVQIIDGDFVDAAAPAAFVLQRQSLNSVKRLNLFLKQCPEHVLMGGYFVFSYRPMDEYLEELKANKKGLALYLTYGWHFIRYRALPKVPILEKIYFSKYLSALDSWVYRRTAKSRRVISRAETWGRMYYWGFEVLDERKIGDEYWVVTRRFRQPETVRKPSFYMLTRLTKVGLNGELMQLTKLRTMYPFSEFIQERVFKDQGLSKTGKFQNDFRLTDYGRVIRKFWLDEIPQIFDWLRGEVKLVGMRATSPHFLSLYPKELYDLYIQTKPGLIPPIFDASTNGFDDIVRIELDYLRAYKQKPISTDIRYFFKTFYDIVIRGVRSK